MSTHAMIGIEQENGLILGIYCHFDGYFEGVGAILEESYQDREKVIELINLGDISSLKSTIMGTVAYGRDRGESETEAREFGKNTFKDMMQYAYIFNLENKWESYREEK